MFQLKPNLINMTKPNNSNLLDPPPSEPRVSRGTEAIGIFPSDIILRTAIISAMQDLRKHPWLLDYAFMFLDRDALTRNEYGQKEMERAKKWFLSTNIPIFMSTRLDDVKLPAISIHLSSSHEDDTTLGDVHYLPSESAPATWPILEGPLSAMSYDPHSGTLVLPPMDLVLVPGMFVVDDNGRELEIKELVNGGTVSVEPTAHFNLKNLTIRSAKPYLVTDIESTVFKETYQVGCHVPTASVYLTYLHSIIVFCLLRYKETLLEGRGFERTVLQSADLSQNAAFDNEIAFSRFIGVTGYVRQYWPKAIQPAITSVHTEVHLKRDNLVEDEEEEIDINSFDQDMLKF